MPGILEELLAELEDAAAAAPASATARRTLIEAAAVAAGSAPAAADPDAAPKPPAPRAKPRKGGSSAAIREALDAVAPGILDGAEAPEAAAPTVPAVPVKAEPVRRPNGELYHPRHLAGKVDVEALRELRAERVPVLLSGFPGCGKTSLVEAAFAGEGGVVTFAGHGEAEIGDLVGTYVQNPDNTFRWEDGPLPKAMKAGLPLFVDDATLTPPGVLARLYPAMDGRNVITLTEHEGEEVVAQPGFYVVAAHNPGVPGAVLSEALASRFSVHLEVPTDLRLAGSLGVEAAVVKIAAAMQKKRKEGEVLWAPEMRELLAYTRIKRILGREAALKNLVSICPPADREAFTPLLAKHLTAVQPLALDEA